ncbi:energy-coupling factor transporter transmembrane component T family protein [Microbacterium endophyticum]|uniref:energy-coupling factor transporter transmembrane component T family protein n=1 Tax=Microbacterium endophyticum TaxID=1526412 RepID=UPI0013ED0C00|nr:energy-coupling factor transporter transmembrane component T [Microbacterium endophyticum]
MTHAARDPYARTNSGSPVRFLYNLNPLAKFAAPLPALVLLIFVRDFATPLTFLALSYVLLLIGARMTRRLAIILFIALPATVVLLGFGFAVWTNPELVRGTTPLVQIGAWTLYSGAVDVGLATGIRLGAIVALALLPGLTTTGPDIARSFVQQLRVPYRVGYTALAAFRFVPRFQHELDIIRHAHRVRGSHDRRGPFGALARGAGYIVPLLAGAIRHAERVALAMDARAFGAYPDRTERHLVPFRRRDSVFVVSSWIATAAVLWVFFPWSLT